MNHNNTPVGEGWQIKEKVGMRRERRMKIRYDRKEKKKGGKQENGCQVL